MKEPKTYSHISPTLPLSTQTVVSGLFPFFCFFRFRCLTVCVFKEHKLQPYHPYSASVRPNCGQWSQRRSRGLIIEKLLFASSTAFLTFLLLIFHQIQSIENLILIISFFTYIHCLVCFEICSN